MHREIFESAARAAATYTSAAFTTQGYSGVRLIINISSHNGSTITPKLQTLDQVSGTWLDVPGAAFAGLSGSNQAKLLTVYPGVAETANESVSDHPGNTIRVSVTVAAATGTFSMGMDLLR